MGIRVLVVMFLFALPWLVACHHADSSLASTQQGNVAWPENGGTVAVDATQAVSTNSLSGFRPTTIVLTVPPGFTPPPNPYVEQSSSSTSDTESELQVRSAGATRKVSVLAPTATTTTPPVTTPTSSPTPVSTSAPNPSTTPIPVSTSAPSPSATPIPVSTAAPSPSATPIPISTPTPISTLTPSPAPTSMPKPTPVPTSSPKPSPTPQAGNVSCPGGICTLGCSGPAPTSLSFVLSGDLGFIPGAGPGTEGNAVLIAQPTSGQSTNTSAEVAASVCVEEGQSSQGLTFDEVEQGVQGDYEGSGTPP